MGSIKGLIPVQVYLTEAEKIEMDKARADHRLDQHEWVALALQFMKGRSDEEIKSRLVPIGKNGRCQPVREYDKEGNPLFPGSEDELAALVAREAAKRVRPKGAKAKRPRT